MSGIRCLFDWSLIKTVAPECLMSFSECQMGNTSQYCYNLYWELSVWLQWERTLGTWHLKAFGLCCPVRLSLCCCCCCAYFCYKNHSSEATLYWVLWILIVNQQIWGVVSGTPATLIIANITLSVGKQDLQKLFLEGKLVPLFWRRIDQYLGKLKMFMSISIFW